MFLLVGFVVCIGLLFTGVGGDSLVGWAESVHFHESNSGHVVYTAHDGCVVTPSEDYVDRGFARVPRSVAAVLNKLDLVRGDDPAEDRMLPVVVGGNQSTSAIMQFQRRISQNIWNALLA